MTEETKIESNYLKVSSSKEGLESPSNIISNSDVEIIKSVGENENVSGTTIGESFIEWEKIHSIESRIISIMDNSVSCECLMNKSERYFEERVFPLHLFSNFSHIMEGSTFLLKIYEKASMIQFELLEDSKKIYEKDFDFIDKWKELEDIEMEKLS